MDLDLPIACTLTEAELRERRQAILDFFRKAEFQTTELENGYAFTFAPTSEALIQVAQLVDLERQCCPFLNFDIVVEAGNAPMRLVITGPPEAAAMIGDVFRPSDL
jgi:hypothetical protein